jgi:hypothetical protein
MSTPDLSNYSAAAQTEFEIRIGSDGIARINIDGECRLRIRLGPDCAFNVFDERNAKPVGTWPRPVTPTVSESDVETGEQQRASQ